MAATAVPRKLGQLSDVGGSTPASGQLLRFAGSSWQPQYPKTLGLFSASSTGGPDQSVTPTTLTKVGGAMLPTVIGNAEGWYNPALARYTPLIAGIYEFTVSVYLNPLDDGKGLFAYVGKNQLGTPTFSSTRSYPVSGTRTGTSASIQVSGSTKLEANGSTDYFEPLIYHTDSVSRILENSFNNNFFSAHLIHAF